MPLALLQTGDTACVARISGNDRIRNHLAELGFTPGSDVKVISKHGGGVIVNIKESRIALNRDMASRIMV
ncbi:MAG: ferrous iron transport protein A [Clostridiales Family XIII bacterium]|nr:ferrous iron transport protein A [Clostridiales Family XIII bacterium]